MSKERRELNLLLKVLDDFNDFLPFLVLVGGWVPFIYSRYLWEGVRHEPLSTVDIDFGFQEVSYPGKKTIADRVKQKDYGEHHISIGKSIPFVPIVRINNKGIKADVDFITDPSTSKELINKLIGKEICVNKIKNFDILLSSTLKINVEKIEVTVPAPSIFVFHKLLTFSQREYPDKQQKDLYYAYYVLFFSPDKDKLTQEVSHLISSLKQGSRVKDNIKKYFKDALDKGPTWIAEGAGSSPIKTFVPDIRQDAFDRITILTA